MIFKKFYCKIYYNGLFFFFLLIFLSSSQLFLFLSVVSSFAFTFLSHSLTHSLFLPCFHLFHTLSLSLIISFFLFLFSKSFTNVYDYLIKLLFIFDNFVKNIVSFVRMYLNPYECMCVCFVCLYVFCILASCSCFFLPWCLNFPLSCFFICFHFIVISHIFEVAGNGAIKTMEW